LHDSRNVFIMYTVGLGLCVAIWLGLQLVQSEEQNTKTEYEIVHEYAWKYMKEHPDMNWQRPELPNGNRV
jgi:hypothetical protein